MIVQHLHHHTSYQQTTGTPLITNDDNIADPTYFQAKETLVERDTSAFLQDRWILTKQRR